MNDQHEVFELHFTAESERQLSRYREIVCTAAGVDRARPHDGAPHLSLTSSPGRASRNASPAVARVCAAHPAPLIQFSFLGLFSGNGRTLFLGATPLAELLSLHGALHGCVQAAGAEQAAFIVPGRFVPHCTLAANLSEEQVARALAAAREIPLPLGAAVASLQLVEYFPAVTVETFKFGN